MADEQVHTRGSEAPAAGEAIHLPGPSYLPVTTAFGIALAVCGIVLALPMVVIGLVIALISIWRWVHETRTDIGELPLEHH